MPSYVRFVSADHRTGIKAKLEILKKTAKGFEKKIVTVKQEDDLLAKSDENPSYQDGFIVQHIDATPGAETIEFNQGKMLQIYGKVKRIEIADCI